MKSLRAMNADAIFWNVLFVAAVVCPIWAAVTTWRLWRSRKTAPPSLAQKIAAAAFAFVTLAYVVQVVAGHPREGHRALLAACGTGASLIAAIAGAASGRRTSAAYLLGSLALALLWFFRGDDISLLF